MSGTVFSLPQRRSGRCVLTLLGTPWWAFDVLLPQHAPVSLILPCAEDELLHLLSGHAQLLALSPQLPWACKKAPTWRTYRQILQTQSLQFRSCLHRRFWDRGCTLPWLQGVSRGDMSPVGTEERPSRGRCSKCGSTTLVLRVEALQI